MPLSAEMSHPETFELFVTGCHALSVTVQMSHGRLISAERAWYPETFELFKCLQDDSSLLRDMSHPEHLNCLLQDAMSSLQRWVMRHPVTVCYRMPCLCLCRDESSWDIWDRMPCLSAEMSHPEHLNCLLQDAILSLCRDESSWDIWTVCLQDCHSHLCRDVMASCRHLNCSNVYRDVMLSLCRDESSWDIWTVCYRMPCSLSVEMSHPETFELFVTGCHALSAEMSHPETFELFVTGCHALSL